MNQQRKDDLWATASIVIGAALALTMCGFLFGDFRWVFMVFPIGVAYFAGRVDGRRDYSRTKHRI